MLFRNLPSSSRPKGPRAPRSALHLGLSWEYLPAMADRRPRQVRAPWLSAAQRAHGVIIISSLGE